MTASAGRPIEATLCSVVAAGAHTDPIGTGGSTARLFAMESPAPWGDGYYVADPEGTTRQRVRALQVAYLDALQAAGTFEEAIGRGLANVYSIQPDPEWSRPDRCRVFLGLRPGARFGEFDLREYSFPIDSAAIPELADAFLNAPDRIDAFDVFRVERPDVREFFVCTHGHVDICCAKFGVPLYRQARAHPGVRAWRMTHFGGHRYAPTAWEFPGGYKWAFLDEVHAARVIERDVPPSDLVSRLRGWSGAEPQAQLLDREGLVRFGWDWLKFHRRGWVVEADLEGRRWRVQLEFEAPNGTRGTYEGVVGVAREVADVTCGPSTAEAGYAAVEYALESVRHT